MANEAKSRETIRNNGARAYFTNKPITDCPYKTLGPNGAKMRRQWVDGYVDARDGWIDRLDVLPIETELINDK